jgi:hypothetical protein
VRKPTDFGGYRDVLRQIRKFWGWEALPKTAKALATILFVEDETTIRGMAKLYLETNGYTVIERPMACRRWSYGRRTRARSISC